MSTAQVGAEKIPAPIDFAPLLDMAPECAAMTARINAGEQVPEEEYTALTDRYEAAMDAVEAQIRALITDPEMDDAFWASAITDGVYALLSMMGSHYSLTGAWDDATHPPTTPASMIAFLDKLRATLPMAKVWEAYDNHAWELDDAGRRDVSNWLRSLEQ